MSNQLATDLGAVEDIVLHELACRCAAAERLCRALSTPEGAPRGAVRYCDAAVSAWVQREASHCARAGQSGLPAPIAPSVAAGVIL